MSLTKATYSMVTGAPVNVFDFMTAAQIADVQAGTGSIDLTSVIQTAINSVYCTVNGYATGGANAGKCLVFPVGVYKIAGNLTIDQPVYLKGEGNGQATDASQRTKFNFTGTGNLFTFTTHAGYCLIEGLSLYGSKAGGVDIATGVYGNVAVEVGEGMGGTFRDVYFESFDIGFLARKRSGDTWGGAYRYLENCKFRNNTYSSAQLGLVTDQHYIACDFRTNDSTGYVYIGTDLIPTDNYQNTFFTDCMFESLGDNSFLTRGLIIRGNAYVKATNCYFEACAVFVDTDAQFVTNSYHRWQNGTSLRIGGGGFADISATSASSAVYALPDLSDTAYWTVSNLTDDGRNYITDVLCWKYTVTNTTNPQITSSDFATYMSRSMQSVPENFNYMVVFLSFDYYTSAADITVDMRVTAGSNGGSPSTLTPTISTYTDNTYYDSASGWKRKCYTLPFANTVGGKPLAFLNPSFLLSGSGLIIGSVVGIRNVKMHLVTV